MGGHIVYVHTFHFFDDSQNVVLVLRAQRLEGKIGKLWHNAKVGTAGYNGAVWQ